MKVSGINDLRSRKYPQLTEFITLLSSNYKTHVAFNWPVTRLEGDYCENTNGYVCQRPAAAGTKVESIGNQRFNQSNEKPVLSWRGNTRIDGFRGFQTTKTFPYL